jgi:hypothetical protein
MQIPASATMAMDAMEQVFSEIVENLDLIPAASFVDNAKTNESTPRLGMAPIVSHRADSNAAYLIFWCRAGDGRMTGHLIRHTLSR